MKRRPGSVSPCCTNTRQNLPISFVLEEGGGHGVSAEELVGMACCSLEALS